MTDGFTVEATLDEDWDYDPFHDERTMECGLENPEVCESCQ